MREILQQSLGFQCLARRWLMLGSPVQEHDMVITSSPLVKTYTLDEFWALPEPLDHSKLELIAGVLYMAPPPSDYHGTVVAHLIRLLTAHLLATADEGLLYVPRAAVWTLPFQTYLEPDLYYISKDRRQSSRGHYEAADLVVEVISPGTAVYNRTAKADTYRALDVRELWLVDPERQVIEVRELTGASLGDPRLFNVDDTMKSSVLPSLSFVVRDAFEPLF